MKLPVRIFYILIFGLTLYIIITLGILFKNDILLLINKGEHTKLTQQNDSPSENAPYTKDLTVEEKAKQKGIQQLNNSQYSYFPNEYTQIYLINGCKLVSLTPLTEKKIRVICTLGESSLKTIVTFYIRSNVALESSGFAEIKSVLNEFAPDDLIRVKVLFIPEESSFSQNTVKKIIEKIPTTQSPDLKIKSVEFYGDFGQNKTSLNKIFTLFTKKNVLLDESTFLIDEILHYPLKN